MKLIELVNAAAGMQKLLAQDMPLKTAYQIAGMIGKFNTELRFFQTEALKAKTEERLAELNNLEVETFEDFRKIQLNLDDDIRLTPSDVNYLLPFFEFLEEEGG